MNAVQRRPRPRVLVDASNLFKGGGVQVAASLIDELIGYSQDDAWAREHPWLTRTTFRLTPEVHRNMVKNCNMATSIIAEHRWSDPRIWLPSGKGDFDLQLTVFGPRYGRRLAPITITGLADGTSVYRRPPGVSGGPLISRLKRSFRGVVSRNLFAREDYLVSETDSLRAAFIDRTGYVGNVEVIPNVVNRAISDGNLSRPLGLDLSSRVSPETILLCYTARYYPHKNHRLLPRVKDELSKLGLDVRFVVTLSPTEWDTAPQSLREACINIGVIPVAQVADANRQCQAAFFPSLLESFSVTPLEALATNGLLFASDRPFVRDVCASAAIYIDPLDATHCARVLFEWLTDEERCHSMRARARRFSGLQDDAAARARNYIKLIDRALDEGASE